MIIEHKGCKIRVRISDTQKKKKIEHKRNLEQNFVKMRLFLILPIKKIHHFILFYFF